MNVCGNGLAMSAFTEKDGKPVIWQNSCISIFITPAVYYLSLHLTAVMLTKCWPVRAPQTQVTYCWPKRHLFRHWWAPRLLLRFSHYCLCSKETQLKSLQLCIWNIISFVRNQSIKGWWWQIERSGNPWCYFNIMLGAWMFK